METPPEGKHAKQTHNVRTLKKMSEMMVSHAFSRKNLVFTLNKLYFFTSISDGESRLLQKLPFFTNGGRDWE
jgi:hypothetical protein